jgi:HTH-type transcriptional regulator/antitoxin HigA
MTAAAFNSNSLVPAWNAFQSALPVRLASIHSKAEYERVVAFMNQLLDVVGDDESHELANLLEIVGQLVEDYENVQQVLPDATPAQMLRFLMAQHDLKQADLSKEVGAQSVVSEILSGHRQINARQAKALAQRFGVSVSAFI